MLFDLVKLEDRPDYLMEMAYNWCSVICENHQILEDWERLLLVCLEIGFRRVGVQKRYIGSWLRHTEHHSKLVDVVFKSQKTEAITDLLHALTTGNTPLEPEHATLLDICTGHLVTLHNLMPFSPRLRQVAIRFVALIGYKRLKALGVDGFTELLGHLHVTVKDIDIGGLVEWIILLLDTIQSFEGARRLSHWYWELLVELPTSNFVQERLQDRLIYNPRIMTQLINAQEWDKLECWMGIIWMVWPPGAGVMAEEDLDRSMVLLFRQRPGASQKLERWMERWSQEHGEEVPESFRRLCGQAHEAAQRDPP